MEAEAMHFIQDLAVILAVAAPVAWLCQRIGLSVIVGFIVAGVVVGPHAPWLSLVTDAERIEVMAQIGLVFLMFGIGLELSIRRLRRLGVGLLLAVSVYALLIYFLVRVLVFSIGGTSTEALFLAGMLMISSSSIIGKILRETGATHERHGQLALGALVVEDVVAVLMLLGSIVQFGGAGEGTSLLGSIGRLGAFVMLMGIAGLLLVPWALKKMSIAADEELQTLGMAGLLFSLAVVAQLAGYSLALGAILLGAIVAETPHRMQIERIFEGMRDVFSAVFFVAIGMQIDLGLLGESLPLVVGMTFFT
ncbi:MAG: cation:proton antiporter, partial [Candidatus Nanopelagicales bacterium]